MSASGPSDPLVVDGKGYVLYGVWQSFYDYIHTDTQKIIRKKPLACSSNINNYV